MKVADAVSSFLLHCQYGKNLSPRTLKAYSIDLTQFTAHLDRHHTAADLPAIDKAVLRGYIQALFPQRKPKTIKRKVATLKALFHFLEREDMIPVNPLRKMEIRLREPRRLPRTVALSDLKRLFHYLYDLKRSLRRGTPAYRVLLRDLATLELLFATGARVSEIAHLRRENLDLDQGRVRILGKGSRERIIHLCDPETLAVLREYSGLARQGDVTGYLFENRRGGPMSDQTVRAMLRRHAAAAGLALHVTPHMLRHSVATLLLEEGVDIRYIQRLLGHSSISTTQIYTEVHDPHQHRLLATKHPRRHIRAAG